MNESLSRDGTRTLNLSVKESFESSEIKLPPIPPSAANTRDPKKDTIKIALPSRTPVATVSKEAKSPAPAQPLLSAEAGGAAATQGPVSKKETVRIALPPKSPQSPERNAPVPVPPPSVTTKINPLTPREPLAPLQPGVTPKPPGNPQPNTQRPMQYPDGDTPAGLKGWGGVMLGLSGLHLSLAVTIARSMLAATPHPGSAVTEYILPGSVPLLLGVNTAILAYTAVWCWRESARRARQAAAGQSSYG